MQDMKTRPVASLSAWESGLRHQRRQNVKHENEMPKALWEWGVRKGIPSAADCREFGGALYAPLAGSGPESWREMILLLSKRVRTPLDATFVEN